MRVPGPVAAAWPLPVRWRTRCCATVHAMFLSWCLNAARTLVTHGHEARRTFAVRAPAPAYQVRSDGSVFFAVRRRSDASCAKIHDEPAVMMPTQINVAWNAGITFSPVL